MNSANAATPRATPEPLPANIPGVQPGGGLCYSIELLWGGWRRWWLKHFRPGYVRRMAGLRQGSPEGAPHEILDPRDLKDCRNLCDCYWQPQDDPVRWRASIPFARWGLAELLLMGGPLLAATVAEVTSLDHDPFVGGPAVRIGIFLSIFNVHVNRAPCASRVIALRYNRGEFLNALDPASALRNENMWIGLEDEQQPHRRLVVRQIAGAIARRIVCQLRPGEVLQRGDRFGMIKFGSRTELILAAAPSLKVEAAVGQKVRGGLTVLARYEGCRM